MKTLTKAGSPKQEALEIVITELERSLMVLEANYQKAVSNLSLLRKCVETDDLTRLLRRGAFMVKLHNLVQNSAAEGREVHVMMIDVDHFKSVNDTHGHQTGDVVLQQISELVSRFMRPEDLAGRYGGEEIIVAMQGGKVEAQAVAERIRSVVESHRMVSRAKVEFKVTLSVGVASSHEFGFEADSLIGRADAALYRAKSSGRNCIIVDYHEVVAA
ncbi:MAG: GGDEF domain-containing protein [Deltaproteobacteria bacterium]|nr:GGDEF domain-containing protein [Deltaproteobacteria bacterium]